jgi:hypothetical protein
LSSQSDSWIANDSPRPRVVLFVYPISLVAGILTLLPFSEGVVGVTSIALLETLGNVDASRRALPSSSIEAYRT